MEGQQAEEVSKDNAQVQQQQQQSLQPESKEPQPAAQGQSEEQKEQLNKKLGNIFRQVKTLMALRYTKTDSQPQEIIPHLYLGSIGSVLSRKTLVELNIKCVLTAMDELKQPFPDLIEEYKIIRVKDSKTEKISDYFSETNAFIDSSITANKNILVHCFAGISRSSTLIIAYLMKHRAMSRDQAIAHIRQQRPIISPNNNFLQQLTEYGLYLADPSLEKMATVSEYPQNTQLQQGKDVSNAQPSTEKQSEQSTD